MLNGIMLSVVAPLHVHEHMDDVVSPQALPKISQHFCPTFFCLGTFCTLNLWSAHWAFLD